MAKPSIFVGSSVSKLDLAYAVQDNLDHDLEVTVWSQGVFALSQTSMASLTQALDASDFGLFVFAPEDIVELRGVQQQAVRDNVVFELGLFIGRLGVERCFMLVPQGSDDLRMPSDLLGLTPGTYSAERQDGNLAAALGPACNGVRKAVRRLGNRVSASVMPPAQATTLITDPNDCLAVLQGWLGQRPGHENTAAIKFADVDRQLGLVQGAALKYLEVAAATWGLRVARKGPEIILLERDYS